jgi:hypothetical protein
LTDPNTITPFAQRSFSDAKSITLDDFLRDSIYEVLGDLLGSHAREALYGYIERNCLFGREDIAKHLPKVFELLEETCGKASRTIGMAIARKLYHKLGLEFQDNPNFQFFDYVEAARTRIARELVGRA